MPEETTKYRGPARRARRNAGRDIPQKSEEQKAREQYEVKLQDAGGKRWFSDDGSKCRIYFNNVERKSDGRKMAVYFDAKTREWQTGKYADEFVSILRERIGL